MQASSATEAGAFLAYRRAMRWEGGRRSTNIEDRRGLGAGTIVASKDVKFTDELAVMLDTFKPLLLTKQALEMDDAGYPFSWSDG